jgi:signal transduction histidine kinase
MHSRAARIGAELQIDSAPGRGTRVTLTLPTQGNDRSPLVVTSGNLTSQNTIKQGMTQ